MTMRTTDDPDMNGPRKKNMSAGVPTAGAMARLTALVEERRAITSESFAEAWRAITGDSGNDGSGMTFGEADWEPEPSSHIRHVAARKIVNTEGIPYDLALARVRHDIREAIQKTQIVNAVSFGEAEGIVYGRLAK
jgi:hypothetical protein